MGAYGISVTCKQRIRDVRHLLIMHIIKLRSSNLKSQKFEMYGPTITGTHRYDEGAQPTMERMET
jgi:hypothetical protein